MQARYVGAIEKDVTIKVKAALARKQAVSLGIRKVIASKIFQHQGPKIRQKEWQMDLHVCQLACGHAVLPMP